MAPQFATAPDPGSQPISPAPTQPSGSSNDGPLVYPADMKDTQDRVKFSVWKIKKADFSTTPTDVSIKNPNDQNNDYELKSGSGFGPVFLPIQPGIVDSNAVEWGGGKINEIERQLVGASLGAMTTTNGVGQAAQGVINKIYNNILRQPGFGGLARLALAEQAVGVQGLLPRVTGSVLNPNLELLFQGPTLRPFQFQFKLSPRNKKEATRVKEIIKFFKKNMAVKNAESNLFLNAPYVFGIEYQKGTSTHQSINLIKKCALQSCSVDYTPLGSYMTYNDDDATMVSYNISLQFQEIIPVYDTDYDDHPIGY